MNPRTLGLGPCLCPGCPHQAATRLRVCAGHWALLTAELQRAWQDAWIKDGSVKVWLPVRRRCLEWLGDGAPAPIPY